MVINEDFYLNLALNEAWKYQGLTYPNPAVGCAIVSKNGELLALQAHTKAGNSHAELSATKQALKKLNPTLKFPKNPNKLHQYILNNHDNFLKDCTYFVTLEPCSHEGKTPSCAKLLKHIKPAKVVIGYKDRHKAAKGGAKILKQANIKVKWCKGDIRKKSFELIEPFLSWQKGNFSFFKLALSKNGVISGGIISNKKSRKLVHKLRDKCDCLAIGGNTIRIDKPILDARYCKGKAPDVMILSRKKKFNRNIALFKVKDRKILITDNPNDLLSPKFCMIEGGEGMLNALPKKIKYFLLFNSSNFLQGKNIHSNLNLKLLWQRKIGHDSYGWYKKA